MAETNASSTRTRWTPILAGVLAGAVCFIVGRLSVRLTAPAQAAVVPSTKAPAASVTIPSLQPAATAPAAAGTWTAERWREVNTQPATAARNAALAALLEKLAASSPDQAMRLAQTEGNHVLRHDLVQAALRGWASTAPEAAAFWTQGLLNERERNEAFNTVFASVAATQPDEAVRVANILFQHDQGRATSLGCTLINSLCDAGHFEIAAQFATSGDGSERSFWLGAAYSKWAELRPEEAAKAALAVSDPDLRNQALHGVVGGWADADPAGLTQFLTTLPSGGDRPQMIGQALRGWVQADPVAASTWINNNELGAELDVGVSEIAKMDLLKPDVAVTWAESVTDPQIRAETLANVLDSWLRTDLPAARKYLESTKQLRPEDRERLEELVKSLGGS